MDDHSEPVFRRVLGADFERLPPSVRHAHDHGKIRLAGQADVTTYLGAIGKAVCWIIGLPATGTDVPASVDFMSGGDGTVHWHRDFAGRRYESHFSAGIGKHAGRLIERMGVITAIFAIELRGDLLCYEIVGARLLGIPLPKMLAPKCIAYESEEDGAFMFDITISLPIFGRLIAYKGVLR
jgi:hypothetical protein